MAPPPPPSYRRHNAAVVVIGDIGRSPRMCNHALSLATQLNYNVRIIGYLDTIPHPVIDKNPHISYLALPSPPDVLASIPEYLALPLKFFWTFFVLFYYLFFKTPFELHLVLMQNPPALPAMAVCWMVARLKSAKWVVDWHNYTYSMLKDKWKMEQLTLPRLRGDNDSDKKSTARAEAEMSKRRMTKEEREAATRERKKVRVEKKEKKSIRRRYVEWTYAWEGWFGRHADASLCVTKGMREDMNTAWGVGAAVFYDRPPLFKFSEVTLEEKHELFTRLASTEEGKSVFEGLHPYMGHDVKQYTRFTTLSRSSVVSLRADRPLLVISSTSWTPDEDFHILLDALYKYDQVAALGSSSASNAMAKIVCVVTGRGPEKEYYKGKIERLRLEHVQIVTPWLEPEDYPRLLAASDIGVSLHTSTSALDLPMKVVDMFGAEIPVLAKRFACLHELVREGDNGRMFDTAHELSVHLQQLGTGHPVHNTALHKLKENVVNDELCSWEDNWHSVAQSILMPELDPHFERTMAE